LSAEFPGKMALERQTANACVRSLDANGSLEFRRSDEPDAEVVRRIPVEAECEDADDVTIHVLLHVVAGQIDELEVHREDSAPVRRVVSPDALRLLVL
jgi:hypothetical protein